MNDILDKLLNGDFSCLIDLALSDKSYTINDIFSKGENKEEIFNKIFSKLENKEQCYQFAYEIFKLIYLEDDLKYYTFYLLHNEYIKLEDLEVGDIKKLLEHTTWGFNYVLDNFDSLVYTPNMYKIIIEIVKYSKDKPDIYKMFFEKVMSLTEQQIKDEFIVSSISKHIYLTEDEIMASLYKNPDDYYFKQETLIFCEEELLANSKLPCFLLFYAERDKRIKDMMIDNFELFFKAESRSKMSIINYFYDDLPEDITEKYNQFYELYKKMPNNYTNRNLSILINNILGDFLLNLLNDKEISYLSSGSTTQVFRIGDLVLKLSSEKHEINTVRDLFLIAPTTTKIIYDKDNKPILVIEVQKYLEKSYDGKSISTDDVEKFLIELDNLGYVVTDPNCLRKGFDNFGFLDDYHDANLQGFSSYEELPEWFKKRPIVLYDVDLVYKKEYEKKKYFK